MTPSLHEIFEVLTSCRMIGGVFTATGLYLGVQLVRAIIKARNIQGWDQATGIIESSSVDGDFSSDVFIQVPHVTYRYTVNGQTIIGRHLSITEINTGSLDYALKKLEGMEVGKEVPVYYNPKKPNESYLVREVNYMPIVVVGLAVVLFTSLGMLLMFNVI